MAPTPRQPPALRAKSGYWLPLLLLVLGAMSIERYFSFVRLVEADLEKQKAPQGVPFFFRPPRADEPASSAHLNPQLLTSLASPSRAKRRPVRFADLPRQLVDAVLAAEDERFFSHGGVDFLAVLRAGRVDLVNLGFLQGASTLTQQFARSRYLSPEKTLLRKLEELGLAILLENRLSKEELFALYAGEVYLGQAGSFEIRGFGQGAETYFGKGVADLNLEEAALLAGLIQAPNQFSPYRNARAALQRRNHVLELMAQKGFITSRERDAASGAPLAVQPQNRYNYAEAPYFVDWAMDFFTLNRIAPREVHTTLDAGLQQAAFEAVQQGAFEIDSLLVRRGHPAGPQVALVAIDPHRGDLLALIGGRDYSVSQFNRATQALRQPGSAFKPFVYAAALQESLEGRPFHAYTLSSSLADEPATFSFGRQEYSPGNYGGKYYGLVTLRQALALSLNVPTVELARQIGLDSVAALARKTGLGEFPRPYPAMALGAFEVAPLDLVQAYMVFANGGYLTPVRAFDALDGSRGPQAVPYGPPQAVLRPEVAFLITSSLESALDMGTGRAVRDLGFHLPAAGKTGTSNDSWFAGYTPELLCVVWVGMDDGSELGLTGAQAALPIWTAFMSKARDLGYLSGKPFPVPGSIAAVEIDPATGMRAQSRCRETRTEYYTRGTKPLAYCSIHKGGPWSWFKGLFGR